MVKRITIFIILFQIISLYCIIKPEVIITAGENKQFRSKASNNLSDVLLETNKIKKGVGAFDKIKQYFIDESFSDFTELINCTKPYTTKNHYKLNLIQLYNTNTYEIRGIKVSVELGDTEANPIQYLVFTINNEALITNVRYSLPKYNYEDFIDDESDTLDIQRKQKILNFLELFATAYNKKDIPFLEKIYSDDALIITGTIINKKPEFNDLITLINVPEKIIRYRKMTKAGYLIHLKNKIFPLNSFIDISFDDIQIIHHRTMKNVYGIKLKQHWKAEKYEDVGYLFLTIYFYNEIDPLVLVRVWQDVDFEGDYNVSVYDFDIIE